MAELYRFAAFISYSSSDAPFARRLHRALESYGIPSALGKFDLLGEGGKRNRRLVRIRYLGARDYACGEIDAAGHMSAARRSLCAADVGTRAPHL